MDEKIFPDFLPKKYIQDFWFKFTQERKKKEGITFDLYCSHHNLRVYIRLRMTFYNFIGRLVLLFDPDLA